MEPPLFRLSELARAWGLHPSTLLGWVRAGRLHAVRTPGGQFRVRADALRAFCARESLPLPPGLAPPQPKVTLLGLSPTLLRALRRRLEPVGFELDIAGDVFAGLLELSTTPRAAFLFDASGEAYDGRLLASALRASRVGQDAKRIALNAREADVPELLASGATLALPEGDVAKTSRAVLEHLGPLGAA